MYVYFDRRLSHNRCNEHFKGGSVADVLFSTFVYGKFFRDKGFKYVHRRYATENLW